MRIRIDGKEYNEEESAYLGEGKEGESYKIGNKVVKLLYNYPKKLYLNKDDVERLKNIKVKVLEHPITSATDDNGTYLGPVSTYVRHCGYYDFDNLKSEKFIQNIDSMVEDSKVYAANNYLIGDLQYDDTIFDENGNFHLIDSGSYDYKPNMDSKELEKINLEEIDYYLLEEVINNLLIKKKIGSKKREIIKRRILEEAKNYESLSEYLKNELSKVTTVSEYIGHIRK